MTVGVTIAELTRRGLALTSGYDLDVPQDCVICAAGEPNDANLDLSAVWVTIPRQTPLPGYVCLVSKLHVREPFELAEKDRRAFWDDVDRWPQPSTLAYGPTS